VGILRRRDIEQAEIAPAEIVGQDRRRIVVRLLLQSRPGVEWMLLALELLLVGKLPARRGDLVLRPDMRGIGSNRLGVVPCRRAGPPRPRPRPPRMICTPAAKPSR